MVLIMKSTKFWNFLRHIKYGLIVRFAPRKNRVYTQFYRFPHQFKALVEKVIPFLRDKNQSSADKPLEIAVFACCTGAEPITFSSVLQQHFPDQALKIRAFDIVDEVVERAKESVFSKDEVYSGPFVSNDFVEQTFDLIDGEYRVKPHISSSISFAVGNMLDSKFMDELGKFDLVMAQNVLFHLPRPQARDAFANLTKLLKPKAALFINGMDTDMRVELTKKFDLQPLEYLVEEIHEDARVDAGSAWAGRYFGRQPFSRSSKDWLRKYCTIYYKG